ncbi:MAG: cell division protein ZapA [Gammaproteobacteria bacterium]|jgi:cell division protein ZapA|nr:cell division protein ZapA [Gammaproteobacteria bacterium]MBP6051461.1 cell division protein ZapA [Pseudomonadales bacterium]MBK6582767.1 cell division protein ZapA [Gammaproteobacteria bacterium]MBK7171258.1 cell division protein ZapA [Gammaproteobacteria bacterium]MBK7518896.1 cell division protein ZapA [Gammaproteobacteria bacterium]
MSADVNTVKVNILDKDYQVSCPAAERDALVESARYLDQQMRTIRQGGKVVGVERIAVMAALNITHELIRQGQQSSLGSQDLQERIRRLTTRIDDSINSVRQMEM